MPTAETIALNRFTVEPRISQVRSARWSVGGPLRPVKVWAVVDALGICPAQTFERKTDAEQAWAQLTDHQLSAVPYNAAEQAWQEALRGI